MTAVASSPSDARSGTTGVHAPAVPAEACPLCGAPLHREQEWCLRCGAAARTRLAAVPNWKLPVAAVLTVIALSLGVLAAALVDLAGSGAKAPTATRIVTGAAAPAATAGAGALPGTTAPGTSAPVAPSTATPSPAVTTPGATTPAARTPGATAPATTTPARKTPGATSPGGVAPATTAPR